MATKTQVPTADRLAIPLTEGARLIGVGLSYCYELMQAGKLKTFKIGRRRMVTRQALQSYIDAQQAEASRRKVA
ncbi:MAG: helix-turn-helix domain-containing protein [Rhodanobacteraceae bacterium]|nr:helix-turn-helix domain-containing protein [Rhodanobacteraceae bacterium]